MSRFCGGRSHEPMGLRQQEQEIVGVLRQPAGRSNSLLSHQCGQAWQDTARIEGEPMTDWIEQLATAKTEEVIEQFFNQLEPADGIKSVLRSAIAQALEKAAHEISHYDYIPDAMVRLRSLADPAKKG